MMSLRALTRALPRSLPKAIPRSVAARPLRPSAIAFQPSFKLLSRPAYAAFSTSKPQFESAGQADPELSAKLADEYSLETESGDVSKYPEAVQQFLEKGPWEIKDVAGEEQVSLIRTFGDEKIRVTFTIADLQSLTEEDDYNDPALDDELDEGSQGRSNRGESSSNDPSDEDVEPAYPARLNVTIEKPGKGAMHIETVSQDGLIQIENVSYFRKPELADANTAEKDWARQNLYIGPPFRNLDSDLQMMLERYLDERGVNAELAMFVPEYIDFKEQREYVTWLKDLKNFVDA